MTNHQSFDRRFLAEIEGLERSGVSMYDIVNREKRRLALIEQYKKTLVGRLVDLLYESSVFWVVRDYAADFQIDDHLNPVHLGVPRYVYFSVSVNKAMNRKPFEQLGIQFIDGFVQGQNQYENPVIDDWSQPLTMAVPMDQSEEDGASLMEGMTIYDALLHPDRIILRNTLTSLGQGTEILSG